MSASFIGVLTLDTQFPRIEGDAGNPHSYSIPVHLQVVNGAGSREVVLERCSNPEVRVALIKTACDLVDAGAVGLISTCGFLLRLQQEIATRVTVPVLLSALSLVPLIRSACGSRSIGILTASRPHLDEELLKIAGIDPEQVLVEGFEDISAFNHTIFAARGQNSLELNTDVISKAAVDKAQRLAERDPNLGGIVLECANLPPYAAAIRNSVGLPVYSILDAAQLLWAGQSNIQSS